MRVKTVLLGTMAAAALAASFPVAAQVPYYPVAPVGYNIYRPMIPLEVLVPPRTFMARVHSTFTLNLLEEREVGEDTVFARYSAPNATMVLTSANGGSLRLSGDLVVETETIYDADTGGTIRGSLTFTSRSRTGMVAQVFSAGLEGSLRDGNGTLDLVGGLNLPATTPYEPRISGDVMGALSSNARLMTTLSGIAEVTMG